MKVSSSTRASLWTLAASFGFWAALAFLAWFRVADEALTAWFYSVIGVHGAVQVYFLVCAALWPRRWRGARFSDFFWTLFPGLYAGGTYWFGRWLLRNPENNPIWMVLHLVFGSIFAFWFFRLYFWPWLAWLLRLRKKPVLTWEEDKVDEERPSGSPSA